MTTQWGAWMRFDFTAVIDRGIIPAGTPVKISKRVSWLPASLSFAFTDPERNTVVTEWPRPGIVLPDRHGCVSDPRVHSDSRGRLVRSDGAEHSVRLQRR